MPDIGATSSRGLLVERSMRPLSGPRRHRAPGTAPAAPGRQPDG
ncbi:hypothetical protein ACFRPV_04980 [Kitasatospora sp. NPDC056808]